MDKLVFFVLNDPKDHVAVQDLVMKVSIEIISFSRDRQQELYTPSIDVAMDYYASSSLPKLIRLASKIQREGRDQVERIQGMVKPAMPEGQIQNGLATNYSIVTYFAGLVRTCQ